jgi:hypothetical protein
MLPRLPVVLGLVFLATLPALCGCSSSNRRDQYYGTDTGANYQIPDAAVFTSPTAGDADVNETAADADGTAADADGTAADADGTAADAEVNDATSDAVAEGLDSGFDS